MSHLKGLHCFISGRVQGVWFRASTQKEAVRLHITGWVKNLSDGRVEIKAFGEEKAIQELLTWLHQGPPNAEVLQVLHEDIVWENHERFAVQ